MFRTVAIPTLFALLASVLSAQSALAQTQPPGSQAGVDVPAVDTGRLTVTGEGEAAIAPDMAIVGLSVLREAETARAALDSANAAMDAVIAEMSAQGVADRDLQTAGFAISPQYVYPGENDSERQPRITGYQVTQTLSVSLRDLDRLGAILDEAVTLGVNQGGEIVFTNDDPQTALTQARGDAVADARDRAETLSMAAGVELGRILSIDENMAASQPRPMMRMEAARSFAADSGVPVATGENTYRTTVTITWELAGQPSAESAEE